MTKVQNFIGGEPVDSVSGATMPLVDPSTGQEFATAPISNEADIDNAYAAASKAFADWKRTTPSHRQKAMLDFAMKVALEAHTVGDADIAAMSAHGFSEEDVWDIAAIAAFFAMSNRLANVSNMRPNDEFYMLGRVEKQA